PETPTYRYIRGNEKQPDKEHPVQPGLPDVFSSGLEIEPISLPQTAWFPSLRRDFQEEDLTNAHKAVANAEAALKKARSAENETDPTNDESKNPNIPLAEARSNLAHAELKSLQARWAADFAKYSEPPASNSEELTLTAAKAERRTAFC